MPHESELEKINKNENGVSDKDDSYKETFSPFRRQALVSFGVLMLTAGAGATAGFSAVLIPQLQHGKHGGHRYSTEMVSWVAAMSCMALIFGNIISGYSMDKIGRRASLILLSPAFILGWVIIALSSNIWLILLGRFITGLCQGWIGPLGPVFVGEVTSPLYRGFFLAGLSLAIALGVFMSHLFGTILHWSIASVLCGMFPLIGCVVLYYVPESPSWYASVNRLDECALAFKWYRGSSPAMKNELEKMIAQQSKKDRTKGKIDLLKENIKKPEFWKPLCIMLTFFVITQLSGVNVISAYTTDIMKELMGKKKYSHYGMLSIDVLRCVSLAAACVLLRKLGRRPMAIFSGTLTSVTLIALAAYLYLIHNHDVKLMPVVSVGLMAINMIVSNLGVVFLPWNMVGELFATDTKGVGSGLSVMMTSLFFFGTVKTAPAMFHSIGFHGTFLFYGLSTLFGTIFLYFCLPETKGRTLLQIEEHFRNGSKTVAKNDTKDAIDA